MLYPIKAVIWFSGAKGGVVEKLVRTPDKSSLRRFLKNLEKINEDRDSPGVKVVVGDEKDLKKRLQLDEVTEEDFMLLVQEAYDGAYREAGEGRKR